jgi:cytochrome c-type biogenesis protein
MTNEVSILLAFAGGLFSFLSPCVLPLIPSYLFFLGGIGLDTETGKPGSSGKHAFALQETGSGSVFAHRRLITVTVIFILGFSMVFVVMSLLLSGTFLLMGRVTRYINIAAGIIVIILGLNVIFNFLGFLNYEKRFHPTKHPKGFVGAFLTGLAFGAGWTPCVGPILGSILLMAGQNGRMGQAALYLAFYSTGLGLPFLGAAFFFDRFFKHAEKLRVHLPLIQRISGFFLISIGLFMLLGRYQALFIVLMKNQWAFIDWAQSGEPLVKVLPALLFFSIAALLPAVQLLREKTLCSPVLIIFSCVFVIFGIVQATGILDSAGLLARWLIYQQQSL